MDELKKDLDKKIYLANDYKYNNVKILKNISVKDRPFSPTSPSTFEKGVYAEVNENQNRGSDWSLVTIDLEN